MSSGFVFSCPSQRHPSLFNLAMDIICSLFFLSFQVQGYSQYIISNKTKGPFRQRLCDSL